MGNPESTVGAEVLRNEWSSWFKRFQRRIGITNNIVTEFWVMIKDGLTMATNFGVHDLHVICDARETINFIVKDTNVDRPLIILILDSRKMLLDFKKVKIRHIFREANRVADVFAKGAVEIKHHFHVLWNHPQDVWKFIFSDGTEKTLPGIVQDCIN